MVAYADLILPDTTYLERWDCISLLDRPISSADAPGRRDPPAGGRARPRRARVPERAARSRRAAEACRASSPTTGAPRYPGGYPDYIVNHERGPGIGSLAGFRGADGKSYGRGAPNPKQLDAYIADGCFHEHHLAPEQRYYKHANKAYLDWAKDVGLHRPRRRRSRSSSISSRCRNSGWRRAATARSSRRRATARGSKNISIRSRSGIRRSTAATATAIAFSAITQRPMHMYHSWGSHNGWLRQITAENCLYMHRARAQQLGIADGDWVWIKSAIGRVKGRVRLMEGVNPDTVWTWNAIGRRAGAAALDRRRAGGDARLPAQSSDHRTAAGARGRLSLLQQRSDHRPGGVVRPARQHREGRARRGRRNLAAVRAAAFAAARRGRAMTIAARRRPERSSAW